MNKLEYLAGLSGYDLDKPNPYECKHMQYCKGHKYAMKCNYNNKKDICQLNKFYNKYGDFEVKLEEAF